MMRYDVKLELHVLTTLLSKVPDQVKGRLRRKIKPIYFSTHGQEIYNAMMEDLKKHGELPTHRTLVKDPGLSDEAKSLLKANLGTKPLEYEEINKSVSNLEKLYTNRVIHDTHELIGKQLTKKTGANLEAVRAIVDNFNTTLVAREHEQEAFYGKKALKTFKKFGTMSASDRAETSTMLKTGWGTYDANTGGFNRGNLVILAATAGSGKSTVAMTLARNVVFNKPKNQQRRGRSLIVSYELSMQELSENLTACLTGIEVDNIKAGTTTVQQKELITKRFDRILTDDGALDIITPKVPRTIHDIFDMIGGKSYDLIVIDYAGLVEKEPGTKKDTREDVLYGNMARFCKQKAQELNCVVVLLAQLNEKDKSVMYSQQFRHNCDVLMKWSVDDEDKESGYFRVEMDKQRRSKTNFDFFLSTEFHIQQCNDVTQIAVSDIAEENSKNKPKPKNGLVDNHNDKLA